MQAHINNDKLLMQRNQKHLLAICTSLWIDFNAQDHFATSCFFTVSPKTLIIVKYSFFYNIRL